MNTVTLTFVLVTELGFTAGHDFAEDLKVYNQNLLVKTIKFGPVTVLRLTATISPKTFRLTVKAGNKIIMCES